MGFDHLTTTLGAICKQQGGTIQTGPFGSQLHASDYSDRGTPVVMPLNLVNGVVETSGIARVASKHVERLSRHCLIPGDIVFSRRGDVTRFALITERERGWLCGTGCLKVSTGEPTLATANFIAAALASPDSKEWLIRHAVGATMPNLNTGILGKLPIRLPPLSIQEEVTQILDALSDRLQILRQTNTTLEAIAQALFKSWFVDFDPVHAKAEGRDPEAMDAATATLFPSEFEESELGLIPKGWRTASFDEVATRSKDTVNPLHKPDTQFEHYSLPAFDTGQLPIQEQGGAIKSNKTLVPPDAVLVSKLNPHIPRIWAVGQVGANAVCSTEFLVWVPKAPAASAFVYCLASSRPFNSAMCQLVTGTSNSHQRVKPAQLGGIRVCAVSDRVMEAFASAAGPLLQKILDNRQQAATLASLRDTLLPRLVSGKLRLPEAEAVIEDVMA